MNADSIDLQHQIATLVESAIMQDSRYASVMDVKSACGQGWQEWVISRTLELFGICNLLCLV